MEALDGPVKFWAQESWKAGAGIRLSNFRSWKAERCARKFEFLENLWYNKRLGVELGARISPKYIQNLNFPESCDIIYIE